MSLDDADDGIALRQMLNQGYADSCSVSVESSPIGHNHFTGRAGRNLTQQQRLGVVGQKFEEIVFENELKQITVVGNGLRDNRLDCDEVPVVMCRAPGIAFQGSGMGLVFACAECHNAPQLGPDAHGNIIESLFEDFDEFSGPLGIILFDFLDDVGPLLLKDGEHRQDLRCVECDYLVCLTREQGEADQFESFDGTVLLKRGEERGGNGQVALFLSVGI